MVNVKDKGMKSYTFQARTVEIGGEEFIAEDLLKTLNDFYHEENVFCYPDSRLGMALKVEGLFNDDGIIVNGEHQYVSRYNRKILRELIRQVGDIVE